MTLFRSAIVASLLATLAAASLSACSSSNDGASSSNCAALSSCCASLSGNESQQCQADLSGATDAQCSQALSALRGAGACTVRGESSDGGSASNSDSDSAAGQPSVCARYLSCVAAVAPSELPASLAAYGPDGTCWNEGASAESVCEEACSTGVQGLRAANPNNVSACPLCASDSDCAAEPSTAVCSVAAGKCVQCTSDAQCGAGHCDTSTNVCVACLDDSQCTSASAPHCDTSASACVGCTENSQCSSRSCMSNGTCCVPKTCAQILPGATCGTVDDGCGKQVSCGSCSAGYCGNEDECTSIGLPCTAGGPASQCGNGDVCAPDAWHQDYRCSPSIEGQSCETYPLDTCEMDGAYMGDPVDDYTCTSGTCAQNCLTAADCAAGQTCAKFLGNPITAQLPGQCVPAK